MPTCGNERKLMKRTLRRQILTPGEGGHMSVFFTGCKRDSRQERFSRGGINSPGPQVEGSVPKLPPRGEAGTNGFPALVAAPPQPSPRWIGTGAGKDRFETRPYLLSRRMERVRDNRATIPTYFRLLR